MLPWYAIPTVIRNPVDGTPALPFAPTRPHRVVFAGGMCYAMLSPADHHLAVDTAHGRRLTPAEVMTIDNTLALPLLSMTAESWSQSGGFGLGDLVSWIARRMGLSECDACSARKRRLNRVRLWPRTDP
jgi:hypothetical protein